MIQTLSVQLKPCRKENREKTPEYIRGEGKRERWRRDG
jgi:hypothetical protein